MGWTDRAEWRGRDDEAGERPNQRQRQIRGGQGLYRVESTIATQLDGVKLVSVELEYLLFIQLLLEFYR